MQVWEYSPGDHFGDTSKMIDADGVGFKKADGAGIKKHALQIMMGHKHANVAINMPMWHKHADPAT
jgi:hypothetical protein